MKNYQNQSKVFILKWLNGVFPRVFIGVDNKETNDLDVQVENKEEEMDPTSQKEFHNKITFHFGFVVDSEALRYFRLQWKQIAGKHVGNMVQVEHNFKDVKIKSNSITVDAKYRITGKNGGKIKG